MGPTPLVQRTSRQTKTPLRSFTRQKSLSQSLSPIQDAKPQRRKRNKFDFDAPQFEDFTKPRYQRRKRILDEMVLPAEKRKSQSGIEWQVEDISRRESSNGQRPVNEIENEQEEAEDSGSGSSNDEWFQTRHSEHEPSSPQSPAGPLITPESNGKRSIGASLNSEMSPNTSRPIRSSPLTRTGGSTPRALSMASPLTASHGRNFPSSTTTTKYISPLGLRSKPMRILSAGGASAERKGSSPSSGPLQLFYPEMNEIKSPTGNRGHPPSSLLPSTAAHRDSWRMEPRSSSSIEHNLMTPRRPSALEPDAAQQSDSSMNMPSITAWSSIPETPPILSVKMLSTTATASAAATAADDELGMQLVEERLPTLSVSKKKPHVVADPPGLGVARRIGLTSRAMRVPAETLLNANPLAIAVDGALVDNSPRPPSPAIKRLRVDARFCPAPAPVKSRSGSPPPPTKPPTATSMGGRREKDKTIKVDDLKKLLAEHNQKLRSQVNITRRR